MVTVFAPIGATLEAPAPRSGSQLSQTMGWRSIKHTDPYSTLVDTIVADAFTTDTVHVDSLLLANYTVDMFPTGSTS